MERRFAAIVAANVVGYMRLMSADEEGRRYRCLALISGQPCNVLKLGKPVDRRLAAIVAVNAEDCLHFIGADEAGTHAMLRTQTKDVVALSPRNRDRRGIRLIVRVAVLALSLLAAGCTYGRDDPYHGQSMALIIVEDWKFRAEDRAQTVLSDAVERHSRSFGGVGGAVGFGAGCIIGGAAGAMAAQAGAIEGGCGLVGIVAGGVTYVVGFAVGAVVGTVEGAYTALQNDTVPANAAVLIAAFKTSDPSAALESALTQAIRHRTDASLTRLNGAQPTTDYGSLSGEGYPFVIILKITEFYVSDYGVAAAGSRVHLAVTGEVIDTATNVRRLVKNWTYTGKPIVATKPTADDGALLKSQMKIAWSEISAEIAWDIFFAKQISENFKAIAPIAAAAAKPSVLGGCQGGSRVMGCPAILRFRSRSAGVAS